MTRINEKAFREANFAYWNAKVESNNLLDPTAANQRLRAAIVAYLDNLPSPKKVATTKPKKVQKIDPEPDETT